MPRKSPTKSPKQKSNLKRPKEIVPIVDDPVDTIDDSIDDYVIIIKTSKLFYTFNFNLEDQPFKIFVDKKSFVWKHFGLLYNNSTSRYVENQFNYCNVCLAHRKTGAAANTDNPMKPRQQILRLVRRQKIFYFGIHTKPT